MAKLTNANMTIKQLLSPGHIQFLQQQTAEMDAAGELWRGTSRWRFLLRWRRGREYGRLIEEWRHTM